MEINLINRPTVMPTGSFRQNKKKEEPKVARSKKYAPPEEQKKSKAEIIEAEILSCFDAEGEPDILEIGIDAFCAANEVSQSSVIKTIKSMKNYSYETKRGTFIIRKNKQARYFCLIEN